MREKDTEYSDGQKADILSLLTGRYGGDVATLCNTWGLDERQVASWAEELGEQDMSAPTIEELKTDVYRQLKGAISRTADPQKLANTIKILEDMKDRNEGKDLEERAKGVAESIASLAADAPPSGLAEISLEPVVADHVKRPRRRKPRPSEEINGLDENSDAPREGLGGAEEAED